MADFRDRVENISALAQRLERDYSHIHAVLRGDTPAGPKLAIAIERETGIPRSELRPDLWPPVAA